MQIPTISQLKSEAIKFRGWLESCDKSNTPLVTDDFPICNCKLSSMLFAYHLLELFPEITIVGISGIALDRRSEETISHYWLEVYGVVVDLTADQYNLIEPEYLNDALTALKPFTSIHVEQKANSWHYVVFNPEPVDDIYDSNFDDVHDDFLKSMERSYRLLIEEI